MPYAIADRYSPSEPWVTNFEQTFETSAEAGSEVKIRNQYYKECWGQRRAKVVPFTLDDPEAWRIRVKKKFTDGLLKPAPWYTGDPGPYFEHIHPDDPTKIRFIATTDDGLLDRWTTMAPGRFYTRFISSDPEKCAKFCAMMGLDDTVSKLILANTAEEIIEVYTNGPHSCMAYDDVNKYSVTIHPVTPYGGSELACAYITRSGNITARCMVWPEKKQHGRIYGDTARMSQRLSEEGYDENWDFQGVKLPVIRDEYGEIVMPYIDGELNGTFDETKENIILTNAGDLILKSPDGLIEASCCSNCAADETPLYFSENQDAYVCGSCMEDEDE